MGRTGYCREHILDSGLKVLQQKGYNGTGVNEITREAGVPKGSFYNHFASKEAFVIEAIEREAAANLSHSGDILTDSTKTPKQRILAFFSDGACEMTEEEFHGGCLIANLVLEMSDESESIRTSASNVMCRQIKQIALCLAEAQAAGELSTTQHPQELAEFIYYAWEGAIMRAKGRRECAPFDLFRRQLEKFFN